MEHLCLLPRLWWKYVSCAPEQRELFVKTAMAAYLKHCLPSLNVTACLVSWYKQSQAQRLIFSLMPSSVVVHKVSLYLHFWWPQWSAEFVLQGSLLDVGGELHLYGTTLKCWFRSNFNCYHIVANICLLSFWINLSQMPTSIFHFCTWCCQHQHSRSLLLGGIIYTLSLFFESFTGKATLSSFQKYSSSDGFYLWHLWVCLFWFDFWNRWKEWYQKEAIDM